MSRRTRETLWRTQNVLRDPRLIDRLIATARITQRDVVYDLGAGQGALTASLARHAGRVIAIEKDGALAAQLRRRFRDQPNVVVRETDILTHRFPHSEYLVFANPPFDITAELLRRLTSADVPPRDAYLVLQSEAAQRFIGRPWMTLAALLVAPWFSVSLLHRFRRSDFIPAPSVDAVFVRLHKRGPPLVAEIDAQLYRDLVAACFAAWRPSVGDALAHAVGSRAAARLMAASHLSRVAKPSELPLSSWLRLYDHFATAPEVVRQRIAGSEARLWRQRRRMTKSHRTRVPRDALDAA
jgi:23S rRNA (adenine-N6)-dimethyltransferase